MSGRKNTNSAPVNGKATSPALACSVAPHLEGKRKEVLRETQHRH